MSNFLYLFSFSLELFALETGLDRSPIGYNLLALDFKGTLEIAQSSLNIAHLNSIYFAVNLVIDPDNNFHLIILSFSHYLVVG